MNTKQLTHDQVVELLKQANTSLKFKVQSNPNGEGKPTILNFYLNAYGVFCSHFNGQNKIDGVYYNFGGHWKYDYKGTYELIPEPPMKPEVYEVGDWVVITEEARKCGDYERWDAEKKNMIGSKTQIIEVYDTWEGVRYNNGKYSFPHYCVQRCEPDQPVETVKVGEYTYVKAELEECLKNLKPVK